MLNWVQLGILTREAVQDAIRRRIVFVVLVVLILSMMMLDTCTSTCNGQLQLEGELARSIDILAWAGVGVFALLTTWILALAGLLASDHLTQSLSDGSALLVLARPVSRATFVLARLLGSLLVSTVAGVILLGGASFLLQARSDLALSPAVIAIAFCLINSVTLASLAMTASLYLPRVAIFLLVFLSIGVVSLANLASISGSDLGGAYLIIDRLGPPLMSATVLALEPWANQTIPGLNEFDVVLRMVVWSGLGVALLIAAFRRREITPPSNQ